MTFNMTTDKKTSLKNGFWIWDELNMGLLFISREKDVISKEAPQRIFSVVSSDVTTRGSQAQCVKSTTKEGTFKETVGNLSQVRFRKYYQRKVKLTEREVVTIQDVKDVALFTCNVSILTPEFISYFHTKAMDNFLRSLVIYFQYYFQVWNKMQLRRKEAARKLRQPLVTELEDRVRDNLADLRSMVARNYAVILLGIGDAHPFHHMSNKNKVSFSDKDRRLFECMIIMVIRVVWIALFRKYITLIEKELNRLLRTNIFSPYEHKVVKTSAFDTYPGEDRILIGKAYEIERKLLHRSPMVQELIFENHDYNMFAIGITDTGCCDERQTYLEAAYSAPEELLEQLQVPVGILGVQRKYLDAMLKPKEATSTRRRQSTMKPIPEVVLPPRVPYEGMKFSETLPKNPVRYAETQSTIEARNRQCRKWRQYVEMGGPVPFEKLEVSRTLEPSFTTLRASVAPMYSKYN